MIIITRNKKSNLLFIYKSVYNEFSFLGQGAIPDRWYTPRA